MIVELLVSFLKSMEKKNQGSIVFMFFFSIQLCNCPSFNAEKDAVEDPIGLLLAPLKIWAKSLVFLICCQVVQNCNVSRLKLKQGLLPSSCNRVHSSI